MPSIKFFTASYPFKVPRPRKTIQWLEAAAKNEGSIITSINFIFCTDKYLLKLNQDFLGHDTLTDIITFDYSEGDSLEGEIYISIPRVRDNAKIFQVEFERELARVLVHGILHMIGYKDKSKAQKMVMRKKEEAYLSLLYK
jgi:rRNA maturation RNase YbeY